MVSISILALVFSPQMSAHPDSGGGAGLKRAAESSAPNASTLQQSAAMQQQPKRARVDGQSDDGIEEADSTQLPAPVTAPAVPAAGGTALPANIQATLEAAKARAAALAAQLKSSATTANSTTSTAAGSAAAAATAPVADAATEALARARALAAKLSGQPAPAPPAAPAAPVQILRFDAQGRAIDSEGNVVDVDSLAITRRPSVKPVSTAAAPATTAATAASAANDTVSVGASSKRAELKEQLAAERAAEAAARARFIDKSLDKAPSRARRPMLNFCEPGQHARQAAAMRMHRARVEQAAAAAEKEARDVTGKVDWRIVGSLMGVAPVTMASLGRSATAPVATGTEASAVTSVPEMEWWDAAIATTNVNESNNNNNNNTNADGAENSTATTTSAGDSAIPSGMTLKPGAVTALVLHPRRLAPRVPLPPTAPPAVILTPAERAKARHIERQVRLGKSLSTRDLMTLTITFTRIFYFISFDS